MRLGRNMERMALALVVGVIITVNCPVAVVPKPPPPPPPHSNIVKYSRALLITMIMTTFARLDTGCTLEHFHLHMRLMMFRGPQCSCLR